MVMVMCLVVHWKTPQSYKKINSPEITCLTPLSLFGVNPRFSNLLFRPAAAFLLAAIISLALHWHVFPKDIVGQHAWRQSQTQTTIRYFAQHDFNILHPHTNLAEFHGTQRLEFPLMQWIIAGACRLFGYSVTLTRILLFLGGLLTIAGMMRLAAIVFSDNRAPAIAGWAFAFSPLFYYYTINPLPDTWAMCAGTWGLALWFQWLRDKKISLLLLSGILLAIGALIKLPFILYFIVVPAYWWKERRQLFRSIGVTGACWLWMALPLLWYILVIPEWTNNPVTQGVMDTRFYSGDMLFTYLWGNFSSTLPELLLNYAATPLFLAGWFFFFREKKFRSEKFLYLLLAGLAVLAYFLFELNLIATVHDYYLFPFLPLLFLLVTFGALRLLSIKKGKVVVLVLLLILPLTAFLRIDSRWDRPGFNRDIMDHAAEIRAALPEEAKLITANDVSGHIWLYYLDREGWNFSDDKMDLSLVKQHIAEGATYFVSDSRVLEQQLSDAELLGEKAADIGTIRVFRLHTASNGDSSNNTIR